MLLLLQCPVGMENSLMYYLHESIREMKLVFDSVV